jgi:hypothetical protein
VIFIDASLPKTLADELKKVRNDVVFKHDVFEWAPTTPFGCGESELSGGSPSLAIGTLEPVQGNAQRLWRTVLGASSSHIRMA